MANAQATHGRRVCTACALLCDDVVPRGAMLEGSCPTGQAAWEAAEAAAVGPEASIDGLAVSRNAALDHAAARAHASRRILVTGLGDLTVEAVAAACDLAEACDAAIDACGHECLQVAGPTIARVGAVTAAWEELRDRADLVVFWFCDPAPTHPRFVERFVQPPSRAGTRRTIAVGPAPVLPPGPSHAHVPLPHDAAIPAARTLEGLLAASRPSDHAGAAALVSLLEPLRRACAAATCAALVTTPADPTGLAGWSTASLVRRLALRQPAFEIPLEPDPNNATAAAVCTWRYGAAGAILRADRRGAAFLPAEADALRLVGRGEVDCVIIVGSGSPALEAAVAARGDDLAVIRVAAVPAATARGVHLRCTSPLAAPRGAMLRGDGRWIPLVEADASPVASEPEHVIAALRDRVVALRRGPTRRPDRHPTAGSGGPA